MADHTLSFTASEVDEKLRQVDELQNIITNLQNTIDTLNNQITTLQNNINNEYTLQSVSTTVTSSTYHLTSDIDITKSGYQAVGVAGWNLSTLGANYAMAKCYVSGNRLYFTIVETQQVTWANPATVHFYILYQKI